MRSSLLLVTIAVVLSLASVGSAVKRQGDCLPGLPCCDVGVVKSAPNPMIIGFPNQYTFQVNINNAGPDDAVLVNMTDIVPGPVTVVSVIGNYSNGILQCSRVGNTVQCISPLLRAGDTCRAFINVTVPANLTADLAYVNEAVVKSETRDNDLTNNRNSAATQLKLSADLAIDVSGPGTAFAGQQETANFTMTMTHLGYSDAQGVCSFFAVPAVADVVFVSDLDQCPPPYPPGFIKCCFGRMKTGDTFTFKVGVKIPPDALLPSGGNLAFTASVNSTTFDPLLTNNVDTHTLAININSNIQVTKSAVSSVVAGVPTAQNPAFYTIVVDNAGPSNGLGVVMTDFVPPIFQLVNVVWQCNITTSKKRVERENIGCNELVTCTVNTPINNFLTCTISELSTSARVRIIAGFAVNASVPPTLNVNNTADVTSQTADLDPSRNRDSTLTNVTTAADVFVNKIGPNSTIVNGDGFTYYYTIFVGNTLGASDAQNVSVEDTVPGTMTVTGNPETVVGNPASVSCNRAGNFFSCNFGRLIPGQTFAVRIPFVVLAGASPVGFIQNCANASSASTFDPILANNRNCTFTAVVEAPFVQAVKTGPANITLGDNGLFLYTIVVTNQGPSEARNAEINDIVPNQFIVEDPVTSTQGGCSRIGNDVRCVIGTLSNTSVVTILIPFRLNASNKEAIIVPNTAFYTQTTPNRNPLTNTTTQTVLLRVSDLEIRKSGPLEICAGELGGAYFTVVVKNLGPSDAINTGMWDYLPSQYLPGPGPIVTRYNQSITRCQFDFGRNLTCELGGIPFGGNITVEYPVFVPFNIESQNVINFATATGPNDPNPANNVANWTTFVCNKANLVAHKQGPENVTAGSTTRYTYVIGVTNSRGPSTAYNVVLSDVIPPEWTFVPNSQSSNCNVSSGIVTCSWAQLAPDANVSASFQFTVNQAVSPSPPSVRNCVTASTTTPETNSTDNTACVFTRVLAPATLLVSKTGPESCIQAGESSSSYFTVEIFNAGPARARNVQLVDALPAGLTAVQAPPGLITITGASAGASCTYGGTNTLSCTLGELDFNNTIRVTFPFVVLFNQLPTTGINTANVSSSTSFAQATAFYSTCAQADLSIRKTGEIVVTAGSNSTYFYFLTVTNWGKALSRTPVVIDTFPRDFTLGTATANVSGYTCSNSVADNFQPLVTCNFADWNPGVTVVITIPFTVGAGVGAGPRTNCANVSSAFTTDPFMGNNSDCMNTTVDVSAFLSIAKTGPSPVCAGSPLQFFTLTVQNVRGPAIAQGVNVRDPLPLLLTPGPWQSIQVSGASAGAQCNFTALSQALECSLGSLIVGQVVTIQVPFSVAPWVTSPVPLLNTAYLNSTTFNSNPINTASFPVTICTTIDLVASKSGPARVVAGNSFDYIYTIGVVNNEISWAANVTLTDVLPIQFSLVPNTFVVTGGGSCGLLLGAPVPTVQCSWTNLAQFVPQQVRFNFTVDQSVLPVAAPGVRNCVTAASPTPGETNSNNNEACWNTIIDVSADVSTTKIGPIVVCAGQKPSSYFNVSVTNSGPSLARNVTVVDPLPAGLTADLNGVIVVRNNVNAFTCFYDASNTLRCNFGDMRSGATIFIDFPFFIQPDVTLSQTLNIVTGNSTVTFDPQPSNNVAQWLVVICQDADLRLTKSSSSINITAGSESLHYFTISVTNAGPSDALNAVVTDGVLSDFTIQPNGVQATNGGSCDPVDSTQFVRCTWPRINVDATVLIIITYKVGPAVTGGMKRNCANVLATTFDRNSTNNVDCVDVFVSNLANLSILKTGPNELCAGGPKGTYIVTVYNNGPSVANGVTMNDTLPVPLVPGPASDIHISGNNSVASCGFTGSRLLCTLGTMHKFSSIFISYTASVPASSGRYPDGVINVAFVKATTPDGTPMEDDFFEHRTIICAQADVDITKSGPRSVVAGQASSDNVYTITVQNNGLAWAPNVTIVDDVPFDFEPVRSSLTSTGNGQCDFFPINPVVVSKWRLICTWSNSFIVTQNETIRFNFTVSQDVAAGQRVNCATVTNAYEGLMEDDTACWRTLVNTIADIQVSKTGPSDICAGDPASQFVITIYNDGPSSVPSVLFTDELKPEFTPGASSDIRILDYNGSYSCFFAGRTAICNIGKVASKQGLQVVVPFSVLSNVKNGTVENLATANSDITDPLMNNVGRWPVRICNTADLRIEKVGPRSVTAGDATTFNFTLTANNDGPSDAAPVTIVDQGLPVSDFNVTFVQSASGRGSCSWASNGLIPPFWNIRCDYPSMQARGPAEIVYVFFNTPASANPGEKQNCGIVSSSVTPDQNTSNNQRCIPITVVAAAQLRTIKTGSSSITAGGAPGSFTVTVTNTGGSDARDVSLNDPVPAVLQVAQVPIVPSQGSCTFPISGNTVRCSLGTIEPGKSVTITFQVSALATAAIGPVKNTACASTNTTQPTTEGNCGDATMTVLCISQLAVTKSDNQTFVIAGDKQTFTYTMVITHSGFSTARSVSLTDTFPTSQFDLGTITSTQGNCNPTGNTGFFCALNDIAVNGVVKITAQYTVPPSSTGTAINSVVVKQSCGSDATAVDLTEIRNRANLVVIKDDCNNEVVAGQTTTPYTFTISVYNAGPSNALSANLTDTWPSVYTRGSTIATNGGICVLTSGGGFECTWSSIPVQTTVYVYVTYTVPSTVLPGYATNCAVARSAINDDFESDNADCDTNKIITIADLEVTKNISSPECVVAGSFQSRVYVVTVRNLGPSWARNVILIENFPSDKLELVSYPSQVCTRNTSNLSQYICSLGDLPVGDASLTYLYFTFFVKASTPAGIVENNVVVRSDTFDPEHCNNNATVCSPICVLSDLSVTKSDGVKVVTAGDKIVYTYVITAINSGPSDARDVVFTDNWPFALGQYSISTPIGPIVNWTGTTEGFVLRLPYLAARPTGQQQGYSFNVSYTVPTCLESCSVCNTVAVSSTSPDPFTPNNIAIDCNQVRTEADLEICKTDNVDTVVAGDGVLYTYTVLVTNNGPSCAQKVKIVDHFPVATLPVGAVNISQGSCIGVNGSNDFTCNALTLYPGRTVTVLVSYRVPSWAATCSITNIAVVSSITWDPRLCNNDAKDVNQLIEQSKLSVTKTSSVSTIPQNNYAPHTFTIQVTNLGPSTARGVTLTDRWPAMLVQFANSITVDNNHTSIVTTGGDFSASIGDLPIDGKVTFTVRWSLMEGTPCGPITNNVTVFSPTDVECREAASTVQISCISATEICRNCIQVANSTTMCSSEFAACTTVACKACYNSLLLNPAAPQTGCFSDATSCAMFACVYNIACGVSRGGPCDSPYEGEVRCPTQAGSRDDVTMKRDLLIAPAAKPEKKIPSGRLLAPKIIQVDVHSTGEAQFELSVSNNLKKSVQLQSLSVQLSLLNGGTETFDLDQTSSWVSATSCAEFTSSELQPQWTVRCHITLASSDFKSVKYSVRGYSETSGGFNPVMGSKTLQQ